MPLSVEQKALFDHAKGSLPRILFSGKNTVTEWLNAFVQMFDAVRFQVKDWLEQTLITNASGRYLDQHARDRGTSRRSGETDEALRARLRTIEDAVTEPALKAGIDNLLDLAGLGVCYIVGLRRHRAHYHTPGSSTAFMSRGYRMTVAPGGATYVVILPTGTPAEVKAAIEEYLRQFGPAGYPYIVEVSP